MLRQENSKNATDDNEPCRETASLLAARFISKLPELRRILATDVEAAYYGDPAATCFGEIISCYPAIRAISNYRIAHELLILGVPLIPASLQKWHIRKPVSIFIRGHK